MSDVSFTVNYAKTGRAGCKKCKEKIDKATLRVGRVTPRPEALGGKGEGDTMVQYYHVPCAFEVYVLARSFTEGVSSWPVA
jgi:DNA ligase-3